MRCKKITEEFKQGLMAQCMQFYEYQVELLTNQYDLDEEEETDLEEFALKLHAWISNFEEM